VDLFDRFPKTRPALPPEFARVYVTHYKLNRDGGTLATSVSMRLESWLHRQVAADVRSDQSPRTTLELGAGTLNQLLFEPDVGPYDIVEPFKELYEGSERLGRIRHIYDDITRVPAGERYDRITSSATLEHICNLPEVIARSGLLLSPQGVFRASIPSEGTFLWRWGWKLTTGLEFKIRRGLDYQVLLRHEHVNNASEIEQVLRFFFRDVTTHVFGLSRWCSFYQAFACRNPDAARCREYLAHMDDRTRTGT